MIRMPALEPIPLANVGFTRVVTMSRGQWDIFAEERFTPLRSLGSPLSKVMVSAQLDALCRESGVKRITTHGLRHTCATLLLSAGVPANVVQRRLGHKKVEMTLNLYAHVLPSMQADAASRLALLLHG